MRSFFSDLPVSQLVHWTISLLGLALAGLGLYLQRRDKRVRARVRLRYDAFALLPTGKSNAVGDAILEAQPGVEIDVRNLGEKCLYVAELRLQAFAGMWTNYVSRYDRMITVDEAQRWRRSVPYVEALKQCSSRTAMWLRLVRVVVVDRIGRQYRSPYVRLPAVRR